MGLLDIDPGMIIWTIITFVLLIVLLRKTAWKPILAVIDEREKTIQESLEQAEKAQQEAEQKMQEYQEKLAEARREAREIINEGKDSAEKIKAEIIEEAETQKKKMIDDARDQISAERDQAMRDIKDSVSDIAISAASKILQKQVSADAHMDIIERSMQDFGSKNQ
ncbi:MAG: F0F1 ATP synthase subunit B [Candidatus Marinimicrobia bacterium]|nr:F0F1 ATP synthase subunit B [Candidatus Neomarinimicrobiota bacterium]